MTGPVLILSDVSKTFRTGLFGKQRVHAVRNVSLTVNPGDVYGFLGPNGAGKTTTVRCLLGLSKHDSGTITRFGRGNLDRNDFFARTAYCPEESHFPPYLTGREQLGHWAGLFGVHNSHIPGSVTAALDAVGLTDAGDRRIGTYSKGMKQRIGIAGCLLSDPDLIVLDEPGRGLDPIARHTVRSLLEKLAGRGVTIFMNSHILSEVERVCTRAGIISDGVIRKEFRMADLETGTILDVVLRPGNEIDYPNGARRIEDGKVITSVNSTGQLAELVNELDKTGGEIISVQRRKVDLEEYFIKVIGEEGV